ncbi:unnamed protein product [Auanema sp. JU1783]|nr:unnamed protein product [Auanema sp. JU1783]
MEVENNPQIKSVCRQKVFFISDAYFFDEQTIIFQSISSKLLSVFYLFIAISLLLIVSFIFILFLYTRKVVGDKRSAISSEILDKHTALSKVLYVQTIPSLLTLILILFLIVFVLILDISFFAMSYFIHLFVIFVSLSGTFISCQHIYMRTEYKRGLLSLLGLSNSVSHTIYASSRRQSTISIINT